MKEFGTMRCHLDAISFNSTEFKNAINFRFRNKGTGLFGNGENPVAEIEAAEVKLADAMAASSAFPRGI